MPSSYLAQISLFPVYKRGISCLSADARGCVSFCPPQEWWDGRDLQDILMEWTAFPVVLFTYVHLCIDVPPSGCVWAGVMAPRRHRVPRHKDTRVRDSWETGIGLILGCIVTWQLRPGISHDSLSPFSNQVITWRSVPVSGQGHHGRMQASTATCHRRRIHVLFPGPAIMNPETVWKMGNTEVTGLIQTRCSASVKHGWSLVLLQGLHVMRWQVTEKTWTV